MTAGRPDDEPILSGDWHLDAEPVESAGPDAVIAEHEPEATPALAPTATRPHESDETPPSPEQIIEAMLFVGGHPLTAAAACAAIRGLTPERFLVAVDFLTRQYRRQKRPYAIQSRETGFVLSVLPPFRAIKERIFGGPRAARLSQPALDVLSVIAYRQPVGKAEVDALRGTDSGAILRQLVRLGLVAVQHRAESGSRAVRYGTTPRFLTLFHLNSLDDLPRLGDTAPI